MIQNSYIKECLEGNNVRELRMIFLSGPDRDPTFETYRSDYEVCKGKLQLFDEHRELSPFADEGSGRWGTDDYWNSLHSDLRDNFSEKRFEHLLQVARVYYKGEIQKLEKNRKASVTQTEPQKMQETSGKRSMEPPQNLTSQGKAVNPSNPPQTQTSPGTAPIRARSVEGTQQTAGSLRSTTKITSEGTQRTSVKSAENVQRASTKSSSLVGMPAENVQRATTSPASPVERSAMGTQKQIGGITPPAGMSATERNREAEEKAKTRAIIVGIGVLMVLVVIILVMQLM